MSGQSRLPASDPGLDLSVGAHVVYGGHGIGRVSARCSEGDDAHGDTVVVEFASGLSVTLPLEQAEARLRPPAGPGELDDVRAVLRSPAVRIEESGLARTRVIREKIAAGNPVGLAEIVRDTIERQRRVASGSSSAEELSLKARRLLAAELAVSANIDEAEADAWIESQLHGTNDE